LQLADSGVKSLTEVAPKAKALVNQALLLDPELGQEQSALGAIAMFYDRNLHEAQRIYRLSMELNPNWVSTYREYAICMRAMGRPDEAIASMKHARDLDPLSVVFNTSLGWEFYYAHHYAEAIEQFQTSIAMDPTFLSAQLGLASAYQQNHMEKEAILAWQDYITAFWKPRPCVRAGKNIRELRLRCSHAYVPQQGIGTQHRRCTRQLRVSNGLRWIASNAGEQGQGLIMARQS
jgi:tetratricopeptide (TPR) repeat protein